jgi:hypothetical protein
VRIDFARARVRLVPGLFLMLEGRSFGPRSIDESQRAGVVLVPQERRADALIPVSAPISFYADAFDLKGARCS